MRIIQLKNISKSYGDRKILNQFSLEIEKGEFIAITGESGAGKSTLMNIMGLLENFESGEYEVCGIKNPKPGTRISTKLMRNELSYLFQNFALINNKTVRYNLELALHFSKMERSEKIKVMEHALHEVGLHHIENKKICSLSGGEQQRVALARILLKPSQIILADEPTGSLDSHNRDKVMTILTKLNQSGKTIIVVSHDNEVVKTAHRVITL